MKNTVIGAIVGAVAAALVILGMGGMKSADKSDAAVKSHLYRVIESGTMRVGIIPDNPGWSVLGSDSKWNGYDVDIANKLAEVLGVKVEFIPVSGPQRLPMVQSDKVDVIISSFTATSERAKSINFTRPYAASGILGLCKKDNVVKSWPDLDGKKLSVPRGTTADIFVTKNFPNADIVRFDAIADAFMALKTGKVDVLMEDDPAVYDLANSNPDMTPMPVDPAHPTYLCMAVQHGDQIWLEFVNRFIEDNLFAGEFANLYEKHFGRKISKLVNY